MKNCVDTRVNFEIIFRWKFKNNPIEYIAIADSFEEVIKSIKKRYLVKEDEIEIINSELKMKG